MECPRAYNCFGCVDRFTNFCPLEFDDDYEIEQEFDDEFYDNEKNFKKGVKEND